MQIFDYLIRLLLSAFLAGIIGIERESIKRPAGFRTHILVCIGATLVAIISIKSFSQFGHLNGSDINRLGAQVISGIGFLGAGTIIKEGISVRGLTTAASLWTVACIGLAVGMGYAVEAIFATTLVLVILLLLPRLEKRIARRQRVFEFKILILNRPGQLGEIGIELGKNNVSIVGIDMEVVDDQQVNLKLLLELPSYLDKIRVLEFLSKVEGIYSVHVGG